MNKNGFTLIELLVVISLVAVIGTTSFVILMKSMNKTNLEKYNTIVSQIEDSSDIYLSLNDDLYSCVISGNNIKIFLSTLKDAGYVNQSLINPKTNEEFSDDCYVISSYTGGVTSYTFSCDTENLTPENCD